MATFKSILITGATGFLGRHLVARLSSKNICDIHALGRSRQVGAELATRPRVSFRACDLDNEAKLLEIVEELQPEVLVHSAGLASPWGRFESFYNSNVLGTQSVLNVCKRAGIKHLVYLSTPSLYFNSQDRFNIKESDPLPIQMETAYATTKKIADDMVAQAAAEGYVQTVSLRPRGIFGPGDRSVLGRLVESCARGFVPIVDGGHSLIDLTYISNAVDALELAIDATQTMSGKIYNISNGEPIEFENLLTKLCKLLELHPHKIRVPYWAAKAAATTVESVYKWSRIESEPPFTKYAVGLMSKSQTLDITAARGELQYKPVVSLEEGLKIFTSWWKAQAREPSLTTQLGLSPLS